MSIHRALGSSLFVLATVLSSASVPPACAEPEHSNELHPSWSPDGKRIVFESDREGSADIYVMSLDSGETVRLTDSPADDARPVWSPDGRWIAFHSNREGSYDLFVVDPAGLEIHRLTGKDTDETNPSWNPESTTLAYEERVGEHTWHLALLDLATRETRPLFEGDGSSLTPTWLSSDRIAFSYSPPGGNHDTDIVLRTISREGETSAPLLGGRSGNSNVQASRADGRLVFNSIRDGNWEIYTASRDGDDEVRLTRSAGDGLVGIDGQPEWSPAGDRVAFTSGRAGSLDIVILTLADGVVRNLTADWVRHAVPGSP